MLLKLQYKTPIHDEEIKSGMSRLPTLRLATPEFFWQNMVAHIESWHAE
jgi:hypothetical protein